MVKQDYGIIISQPGVSVTNATGSQITFNTANALIKIDTQNKAGFQTFTIIIVTDPPNPAPGGNAYTQLYKFKHGYNYIPSVEMLCSVITPPPSVSSTQTYFQDSGSLGQSGAFNDVIFYSIADSTYVYFYILKSGGSTLITGTNLLVSTHVFVEGVLDT